MRRVSDEPGINRVAWDLRYDSPAQPGPGGFGGRAAAAAGAPAQEPDTSLAALRARRRAQAIAGESGAGGEEGGGFGGGAAGPSVLPGTYTVTVSADGKTYTKTVQVENDPRSDMTASQLTAQNDAAMQSRDLTNRFNRVLSSTDDLIRQLTTLQEQFRRTPAPVAPDVSTTLRDLKQFRDSVLTRPLPGLGYRQYPRLREEIQTVSAMVTRPLMPPTAGEMLRLSELKTETDQAQTRLDGFVNGPIAKINAALNGTPHIVLPRGAESDAVRQ
jgi:hypothetical protein